MRFFYIFIFFFIMLILYIHFIKRKPFEKFVEKRKNIDTVLDNYCLIKTNNVFNNYEGPWINDRYYNYENTRCGRYECPKEACNHLIPDPLNSSGFVYEQTYEPQDWVEDSNACISKQITSNYICGDDPPTCQQRSLFDETAFQYTNSNWVRRNINYFMNSSAECILHDVNSYDSVKLLDTETNTKVKGLDNSDVEYYNKRGPSCRLRYKYDGYYTDDKNNTINIDTNFEFIPALNAFRCQDGSLRRYGRDSTGLNCQWIDTECSSCNVSKHTCYTFDENDRVYNKNVFLDIFFDHDNNSTSPYEYNRYLVNNDNSTQVDNWSFSYLQNLEGDSGVLDNVLIDKDGSITTYGDYHASNCRTDIDIDTCSHEIHNCYIIGSQLDDDVKPPNIMINSQSIRDNSFFNVSYKRRWDSNGENCEYCMLDTEGVCKENQLKSSKECPSKQDQCPKGTEYVNSTIYMENPYCGYCGPDKYYDESTKVCKSFTGCPEGKYFDPLSTIDSDFRLYQFDDSITFAQPQSDISQFEQDKYTYLDDNTDSQCKSCTGNTYMDMYDHTNLNCKECPFMKNGFIMTTETHTDCEKCVLVDNEYTGSAVKRIKYDNGKRTCETCPSLPTNDPQKDFSEIRSISSSVDNQNGRCYRFCSPGSTSDGKQISRQEKDWNGTSYPLCDFECRQNYVSNGNNTCEPCPAGTHRPLSSSSCIPCESGKYNNVPGTNCKSCPSGTGVMINQSVTSGPNYDSINNCKIQCVNSDVSVSYGETNYNVGNCPGTSCLAGYTRTGIVLNNSPSGMKFTEVEGTLNQSSSSQMCSSDTPVESDNRCPSGYYEVGEYNKEKYCCRHELIFNVNENICECPPATDNGSSAWNGSVCETTCRANYTKVLNTCKLVCKEDQYKGEDSCIDCPLEDNAYSMTTRMPGGGNSSNDCKIKECKEGYEYNGYSCVEQTSPCTEWTEINSIPSKYIKIDSIYGDGSNVTAYEISQTEKPPLDCLPPPACPGKNIVDPSTSVCCSDGNNANIVNSYTTFDINGKVLNKQNSFLTPPIFCCPPNKRAKASIATGNTMQYGCCPTGTVFHTDQVGNQACCPTSSGIISYYELDNNTGQCKEICNDNYEKVNNVCTEIGSCPAKWKQRQSNNRYIKYSSESLSAADCYSAYNDADAIYYNDINDIEQSYNGNRSCTQIDSSIYCCPDGYFYKNSGCYSNCVYKRLNTDKNKLETEELEVRWGSDCPRNDDCPVGRTLNGDTCENTVACYEGSNIDNGKKYTKIDDRLVANCISPSSIIKTNISCTTQMIEINDANTIYCCDTNHTYNDNDGECVPIRCPLNYKDSTNNTCQYWKIDNSHATNGVTKYTLQTITLSEAKADSATYNNPEDPNKCLIVDDSNNMYCCSSEPPPIKVGNDYTCDTSSLSTSNYAGYISGTKKIYTLDYSFFKH